ncbi:MAG: peptidylprolyl isomerase [Muribaculaceae bacterium]|nr:peptidylprolyl isomerase [Muribaculaceae bacterium]
MANEKTNEKIPENNSNDATVEIKTSLGDIIVKLFGDTPQHRDNFLRLVKDGYYNGTLFHRVINEFMVQAGDPNSKNAPAGKMLGDGDPGYTLPAEIDYPNHFHKRGALAAARTGDNINPERRSSGSQFYIVTGRTFDDPTLDIIAQRSGQPIPEDIRQVYKTEGGTPHLDGAYTVFGEVVKGMDVVDKIQQVETDRYDRPLDDVKIISMTVVD